MPVDHYENFPVASWLIPAAIRPAVETVYAFARTADDLADEGAASSDDRLRDLNALRDELARIESGQKPTTLLMQRLAHCIAQYHLPLKPFFELLSAFSQDVTVARYATYAELLDYCRRSANPVGHLMLHLFDRANPANLERSDAICTALQLTNFWQDIALDWAKGRVYIPQEDLARYGVHESQLADGRWSPAFAALMDAQIDRTRALMLSGGDLARELPGRFGWEIRLTVLGGLRILEKIQKVRGRVFTQRPTLKPQDWATMTLRALVY